MLGSKWTSKKNVRDAIADVLMEQRFEENAEFETEGQTQNLRPWWQAAKKRWAREKVTYGMPIPRSR
jgi:hypothetical protein